MHRLLARRPSPAMVVALVALFISLGGGAYAALRLPRNSVGTAQLKKGAVTGDKLSRDVVTSPKVKDHSLLAKDFSAGQLPAGPQGPKGATGPQGLQGPAGPSTGPAGGDLTGSYPDPSIAPGAVTNAKLANPSLTITPGTGLTGGGSIALGGSGTLNVDPTAVQSRVSGTCASGSAISSIDQTGTVGCQSTNTTQMMGGSIGTIAPSAGPVFLAPIGLSTPNTAEADVETGASQVPSTASNLDVNLSAAPGGSQEWLFVIYVNGTQSGLSCVVPSALTRCSSGAGSNSATIPAGATVTLGAFPVGNSPAPARVTFGWTDGS